LSLKEATAQSNTATALGVANMQTHMAAAAAAEREQLRAAFRVELASLAPASPAPSTPAPNVGYDFDDADTVADADEPAPAVAAAEDAEAVAAVAAVAAVEAAEAKPDTPVAALEAKAPPRVERAPLVPVPENVPSTPAVATQRFTARRNPRLPHRTPVVIGTTPQGRPRWGYPVSPEEQEAVGAPPEDHADDVADAGGLNVRDRIAQWMGNMGGRAP